MAKQILWSALKSAIPPQWIAAKNETDLSITLKGYGSALALRGADNPDSLRGVGLDFAILDEFASMHPEVWPEIIHPALADRRGEALFLGTPRGFANCLYELWDQAQETEDWAAFKYTTAEGGLVPPEEIEAVRSTLDPRTYAQEFDADFAQSVNRVYLMFSRDQNVRADVHDTGGDLWIGLDFNVNPMSAVVGTKAGDELHIFDELTLFNSNTQEMAEALRQRYRDPTQDLPMSVKRKERNPPRRLVVYPDPTGRARKTSAAVGMTDFAILEQAGFKLVAPFQPYAIVDRVNSVNAMLCNVQGRRRTFIHPRCKRLITALEQLPYKEGTNLPDKSLGIEHHADGLGYLVIAEFPIVTLKGGMKPISGY
jgi:hypothetical protein